MNIDKRINKNLWAGLLGLLVTTGCANVLTEMSDKDSDRAKLFDAQSAIDQGQWSTAITKISQMSTTYQAQRDIQVLKASAFAGRCGLNIFQMMENVRNNSASNLFAIMMNAMAGATAGDIADCISAESILKSITTLPSTEKKENLLMALTALAKIGSILALRGDANGDGVLDWNRSGTSFPCNPGTGTTVLPVSDVNEIGTGFILFITSMAAFGTTGTGTLDSLTSYCSSLPPSAPAGLCTMTETSAFNGASRNFIRRLVEQTTGVGLGTCTANCLQGTPNECDNVD